MPICAKATRGFGTGISKVPEPQRRVARANQPQIRCNPRQQQCAGGQGQPGVNMQHRAGHSGVRQQRQRRAARPRPRKKVSVPNAMMVAICFALRPRAVVSAIAHGAAAHRIQSDVVPDGIAHERDQGDARIGHSRAGESHRKRVIQGQTAIAGAGEESGAQQFHVRNCPHARQDVAPVDTGRASDGARRAPPQTERLPAECPMELCVLCVECTKRAIVSGLHGNDRKLLGLSFRMDHKG